MAISKGESCCLYIYQLVNSAGLFPKVKHWVENYRTPHYAPKNCYAGLITACTEFMEAV